jgi:hypothetical protein
MPHPQGLSAYPITPCEPDSLVQTDDLAALLQHLSATPPDQCLAPTRAAQSAFAPRPPGLPPLLTDRKAFSGFFVRLVRGPEYRPHFSYETRGASVRLVRHSRA